MALSILRRPGTLPLAALLTLTSYPVTFTLQLLVGLQGFTVDGPSTLMSAAAAASVIFSAMMTLLSASLIVLAVVRTIRSRRSCAGGPNPYGGVD